MEIPAKINYALKDNPFPEYKATIRWNPEQLKDAIRKFTGEPVKTIDMSPNRGSGWMK